LDYCRRYHIQLRKELGHGLQGIVYATSRRTAIKIHARQRAYLLERDAYLRLRQHTVHKIRNLIVPQLCEHDDENLIIEMTLVAPPFLLDFGGAYLDELPDHASTAAAAAHWDELKEEFGDDWDEVNLVLKELTKYGVHVLDVNPRNVRLR